jgi:hypothetical protein
VAPQAQQTQQNEVDQDVGYYVYAIVPADLPVPPLRGLDDVEVETIAHDDIAAVVTRFALERPPGRKAELVARRPDPRSRVATRCRRVDSSE